MMKIKPQPADGAWLNLLESITREGTEEFPRGKRTKEIIGKTTKFDMSQPIVTVANRKLGYKFLAAEAWWIMSGSNRVDEIAPYSKMISSFSDDGLTFRGAYGPKIQDQLPWVAEQLKNDPFTRQAVLSIWRERPGPSRDYPCTLGAQWILRQHEGVAYLHCQVTMRSSDAWLGVPYDWFNFSMQTAFLIAYMRTAYPDVFNYEIRVGQLTFTAGSQHLYEEHFDAAQNCTFESDPAFSYEPLSPDCYQSDPYRFLRHVKSLADREPISSPFLSTFTDITETTAPIHTLFPAGYLAELYALGGAEAKTGFDAESDPRGLGAKK